MEILSTPTTTSHQAYNLLLLLLTANISIFKHVLDTMLPFILTSRESRKICSIDKITPSIWHHSMQLEPAALNLDGFECYGGKSDFFLCTTCHCAFAVNPFIVVRHSSFLSISVRK